MRLLPSKSQLAGFVLAWIFFTVIGIIVSSQFIMAEVSGMGLVVPLSARIETTMNDIIGMAPLFGVIFGSALLISILVAGVVSRFVPTLSTVIHIAAAASAIVVTLEIMKAVFAITAIAATRDWDGYLSLCLIGGLAGYVFIKMARAKG